MKIGFVCFGEINTPYERLQIKHDHAIKALSVLGAEIIDAGIVVDDSQYKTADQALKLLKEKEFSSLICCVAGWVPSHAVIRVTDAFRHLPMVLWGMCGWYEGGRLITTADQAGTTALRGTFENLDYRFKYVYSIIGEPEPLEQIGPFTRAAHAASELRTARVGTMGYRDMLLYGTQYEGISLRNEIGVEVEPFEMLEMVQSIEGLTSEEIEKGIAFVKDNWKILKDCDESILRQGVEYALALGKKIKERNLSAITLIDVDGMKKLLSFPPAMVFMLLDHWYDTATIPENDVLGSVTQLMLFYLTGQTIPYMEFYEFFKESVLIGVPDFIPHAITDGETQMLPTSFGLLSASLLNVSKAKTGFVTCARLFYTKGRYCMHLFTGEAKPPMKWEEYGWTPPAPQLPSLELFPISTTVPELAQKVASQHILFCYGDHQESIRDLCKLLKIQVI